MPEPTARTPMPDVDLEAALRDLAEELAIPSLAAPGAGFDPAARAARRIAAGAGAGRRGRGWFVLPTGLPLRRAILIAAIAILAVAVVAGALGLGLPGIRIVPAPSGSPAVESASPGPSSPAPSRPSPLRPSPSIAGPLGSEMGLGDPIAIADAPAAVDFPIVRPTATGVGAPVSAWLLDGRLSFVWPAGPVLPPTGEPAVGLILSEFRGSVDPGYFEKIVGPGTTVTTVRVGGVTGYWISGAPHEIVFVDKDGAPVFDSRRIVGDTLLWSSDGVTYRLESALEEEAAVALADSLR